MRFSAIFAAAFAAVAVAQSPNAFSLDSGFSAVAGKSSELTWNPTTGGTVTLTLRSGSPGDLDEGTVIVAKTPNDGSYSWTPDASTPRGTDYTIEIKSDSNPDQVNYSAFFTLESTNTGGSTTSSGSSSSKSGYPTGSSSSSTSSGKYPITTGYSNHSSTTTSRYTKTTEKATLTHKTYQTPTTTGEGSTDTGAPTDAAALNHAAPMLALAIAGAVVAL